MVTSSLLTMILSVTRRSGRNEFSFARAVGEFAWIETATRKVNANGLQ